MSAHITAVTEWFAHSWPTYPLDPIQWVEPLPDKATVDELDQAFLDWKQEHPYRPPPAGKIAASIRLARRRAHARTQLAEARNTLDELKARAAAREAASQPPHVSSPPRPSQDHRVS